MKSSFDPNCQLLAAQYLRRQCKQLSGQIDGLRDGSDIESVHRARVASRRMRAALGIFRDCFPDANLARWQKQVGKLTKGLGKARDLDVQREYLVGALSRLPQPESFSGIARLLVRTELARDKRQWRVCDAVDRLGQSGVVTEMLSATKAVLKGPDDEVSVSSPSVLGLASEHIGGRLAELLAYQTSLEDPHDLRQHHAMRIAAKGLRYTMEVYKPCYGGRLDDSLNAVKQIQTLLGDLHDCDVWIERLPLMLEKERVRIVRRYGHAGPLERLEPGVRHLFDERRQQRQSLFCQLQDFWREQAECGTWERLEAVVRGDEAAAPTSRPTIRMDMPPAESPAPAPATAPVGAMECSTNDRADI